MMFSPFGIIVINALAYILTAYYFYRKNGFTITTFLFIYISIFSIGSVVLLSDGLYFEVMESAQFTPNDRISIIPYILCYIFNFILLAPTHKVNLLSFNSSLKAKPISSSFYSVIIFIEVVYALIKILQTFVVSRYGFGVFHDLGSDRQNAILYGSFPPLLYINYLGKYVNIVFMPMLLVNQIISYRHGYCKFKKFSILFYLYFTNSCLVGLVAGSRAAITFGFLNTLFFYILFKDALPRYFNKKILKIFFSAIALMAILFLIISVERMGDRMSGFDGILRYAGESFCNLGYEYWNLCLHHTGGLYTFGSFVNTDKELLFLLSNVHTYWFATVYGYLFVDFGSYIPLFISLLFSLSMRFYLRNGLSQTKICLTLYYFQLCYQIPFGWGFEPFDLFMIINMLLLPVIASKFLKIS